MNKTKCPYCGGTKRIQRQSHGMKMTLFCGMCGHRWEEGLLGGF